MEGKRVDYLTESELIYRENNMMRIIFLKPISQMITANAVYDYKDKDKIFLEKNYGLWIQPLIFGSYLIYPFSYISSIRRYPSSSLQRNSQTS